MALELRMPQFDPDGRPAVVLDWLAAEGDPIAIGQEVVRVEGDKTVLALESFAAGQLLKIVVPAGLLVGPHTILGIVGSPDEDLGRLLAEAAATPGVPSDVHGDPS